MGGAEPGSVLHGAVAELLAAMGTPDGGCDTLPDHDLPALQRLRTLVTPSSNQTERPELLAALAGQLAAEPLLVAERADLLRRLVDRTAEPAALLPRLRDLAEALQDAGVTVTLHKAGRLHTPGQPARPRSAPAPCWPRPPSWHTTATLSPACWPPNWQPEPAEASAGPRSDGHSCAPCAGTRTLTHATKRTGR
ncbi:hypothetical protein [Streptomyces sp. NPDC048196]|uniref:hypothetical protein n=1 Tax=Streptomyces sp. NPDC048196 TaxID=3154712 RepID=UPI0033FF3260